MQAKSIIVLLAIGFSIFSPLSLHLTVAHGHTSIDGFDVCHAGSLALSAGHNAPCVSEPFFCPCPPSSIDAAEIPDPVIEVQVLASQEEHPPKI